MFKLLVWFASYGAGVSVTVIEFDNRFAADLAHDKIVNGAKVAMCDVPSVLKLYDDIEPRG